MPDRRPAPSEGFRGGAVTAALTMAARAGNLAAAAVVAAGGGAHVAFTTNLIVAKLVKADAAEMLAVLGIDASDELAGLERVAEAAGCAIDWAELAARAGEPVDVEGWRAWALDRLVAVDAIVPTLDEINAIGPSGAGPQAS